MALIVPNYFSTELRCLRLRIQIGRFEDAAVDLQTIWQGNNIPNGGSIVRDIRHFGPMVIFQEGARRYGNERPMYGLVESFVAARREEDGIRFVLLYEHVMYLEFARTQLRDESQSVSSTHWRSYCRIKPGWTFVE
jgi:hypothetical protein